MMRSDGTFRYELTPPQSVPGIGRQDKVVKEGELTPEELKELGEIIRKPEVFSLKDEYACQEGTCPFDLPTDFLEFELGGRVKKVRLYQQREGVPPLLSETLAFTLSVKEKYVWENSLRNTKGCLTDADCVTGCGGLKVGGRGGCYNKDYVEFYQGRAPDADCIGTVCLPCMTCQCQNNLCRPMDAEGDCC